MTQQVGSLHTSASASAWDDVRHDVVLCNFGGPTSEAEVQPFLLKLFEDPFIIRARIGATLRGYLARRIAKKRAPKAALEYAKIGYSPINRMTEAQARHLEARLRLKRPNTRVLVCNRYTAPYADEVVAQLDPDPKKSRIFVTSLYPHICHSTTVSSYRDFDLAFERRFGHRDTPNVRVFSWWHNRMALDYAHARMVDGLTQAIQMQPSGPICVVVSAHGIPTRYNLRGDPYVNEIGANFVELERRSAIWLRAYDDGRHASRVSWHLSFQSRVGPVEWVKPYTDATIERLGKSHGGCLLMVPISFTADHIETLYEMDHTYRELGMASGFSTYARVKPANDDPLFADCMADVLAQHGF